jgi:hypothetical protein
MVTETLYQKQSEKLNFHLNNFIFLVVSQEKSCDINNLDMQKMHGCFGVVFLSLNPYKAGNQTSFLDFN